jgi:hypothetical protein
MYPKNIELSFHKSCSEKEQEIIKKYWEFNDGVFTNQARELAKEYNFSTSRKLLAMINNKSRMQSRKSCCHPNCNRKFELTSRSKYNEYLHTREIKNHFPKYYYRNKNKHDDIESIPFYRLILTEELYCAEHAKEVHLKKKKEKLIEFSIFKDKLKKLSKRYQEVDLIIKENYSENELLCSTSLNYKDVLMAYGVAIDYWSIDDNYQWEYEITDIMLKYNIDEEHIQMYLQQHMASPTLEDRNGKAITKREDLIDYLMSHGVLNKDEKKLKSGDMSEAAYLFSNTDYISDNLIKISKDLPEIEASILKESAIHMKMMYLYMTNN